MLTMFKRYGGVNVMASNIESLSVPFSMKLTDDTRHPAAGLAEGCFVLSGLNDLGPMTRTDVA